MQRQADELRRLALEIEKLRGGCVALLLILAVMSAKYWGMLP